MKKIVRGNDFTLRILVKKIVNGEQVSFPLTDCTDIAVHVVSQYKRTALPYTIDKESNDVLLADVDGTTLSLGTYALEVTGVSEGANWRSYEYEQFAIVDNNASSDTVFETTQPDGDTNIEDGNGDNANKGCMDVKIEGFAVDTALVVLPPVSSRATIIELIANADAAIAAVRETEAAVKASEDVRVESETLRQSTEEQRAEREATRQTAETQRTESEMERVANEEARKANEEARVAAEEQRAATFTELSEAANAVIGKADEAIKASVVVTIDKAENGSASPFGGVAVTCAIANGDTTTMETDSEGKVTFRVPYNKKYKITAAQKDGYYVFRGVYEKNNVADVAEHNLYFHYYPTTSGVFILDATGAQYTADEWQAAGKTAEEAVLIKLVTQNLANGNNCFGFSPAALQAGYPNKQWCTQNVQFNNIPLNGNNVKDALYYNGVKQSKLVREEAEERGLSIPLFTYAYEQTVNLADVQLHGFILTIGQMTEANVNTTLVDEVVKMLHGSNAKLFSSLFSQWKWTSTQFIATGAWSFSASPYNYTKSISLMALPVFAC